MSSSQPDVAGMLYLYLLTMPGYCNVASSLRCGDPVHPKDQLPARVVFLATSSGVTTQPTGEVRAEINNKLASALGRCLT